MRTVILNDTRYLGHYGCSRVMDNIDYCLKERCIEVVETCLVGDNWRKDRRIIKAFSSVDFVLVNGEGTIHHGATEGRRLIEIAKYLKKYNVPAFLINCSYQTNPDDYSSYLKEFTSVWARESLSQNELIRVGINCGLVPDMVFYRPPKLSGDRHNLGVTCSRLENDSKLLLTICEKNKYLYMPVCFNIKIDNFRAWYRIKSQAVRRNGFLFSCYKYLGLHRKKHQVESVDCKGHADYIHQIAGLKGLYSGRFHSICFSIIAETPFISLPSNTHKIEALLMDVGLARARVVSNNNLINNGELTHIILFSEDEVENIKCYIHQAQGKIEEMFDEIVRSCKKCK